MLTQEFATKTTTLADTTYTMDVTSFVKTEAGGDKTVSFCLTDTTNNNTDIRLGSTRGFVQAPQLLVYSITAVNDKMDIRPVEFSVFQNYPNPFNPETKIAYNLPNSGFVKVTVFDILGNNIGVLVNEVQKSGLHEIRWNASSVSSGIYFYRVQHGVNSKTNKMILMK